MHGRPCACDCAISRFGLLLHRLRRILRNGSSPVASPPIGPSGTNVGRPSSREFLRIGENRPAPSVVATLQRGPIGARSSKPCRVPPAGGHLPGATPRLICTGLRAGRGPPSGTRAAPQGYGTPTWSRSLKSSFHTLAETRSTSLTSWSTCSRHLAIDLFGINTRFSPGKTGEDASVISFSHPISSSSCSALRPLRRKCVSGKRRRPNVFRSGACPSFQ